METTNLYKTVTHDFKRWWAYKDVFEERPEQKLIFKDDSKIKVICAGRRWGKSTLLTETAIYVAININHAKCWIVAPNFNRAKSIFWKPLVNRLRFLGFKDSWLLMQQGLSKSEADKQADMIVNKVALEITLRNKYGSMSEICLKSAINEETLVGDGLDWFGFDEARYIFREKPDLFEEQLLPALTESEYGRCMVISTPNGKDKFWELYDKGDITSADYDPSFKSWHFKSATNPYIDLYKIEQTRRGLSKDLASQEYDANFITAQGQVYKYFNREVHLKKLELDYNIPLCLTFDFNRPLQTTTVCQLVSGNFDYSDLKTQLQNIENQIAKVYSPDLGRQREAIVKEILDFPVKEQSKVINVLYSINNNDFTIRDQCSYIKRWLNNIKWTGIIYIYGDATGEQKHSQSRESNWQQIRDSFSELPNEKVYRYYEGSVNPSISERVECVLNKLLNDSNEVGIYFNNSKDEIGKFITYPIIRDMEQVAFGKDGKPDKRQEKQGLVHNSDNLGYMIEYEFPLNQNMPQAFFV